MMNEPQNPPPTRGWQPSPQDQPGQPQQPPATRAWQPSPPGQPSHQYAPPGYAAPQPPPSGQYVQPGPSGQFDAGPPPGYEPTTAISTGAAKRRPFGGSKLRTPLLGLLGLVVLAVLVTGFWKPGFLRKAELDVHGAENGVRQVLTDPATGYGLADVTDVRCNDGKNPEIKVNATFTCEATIAGTKRTVEVTFADDKGSYWVGSPS